MRIPAIILASFFSLSFIVHSQAFADMPTNTECLNGKYFHTQRIEAKTLEEAWKSALELCPGVKSEIESYERRITAYSHQYRSDTTVGVYVSTDSKSTFVLETEEYEHGSFTRTALPIWITVKGEGHGRGLIDQRRADYAIVADFDAHFGSEPKVQFSGILQLSGSVMTNGTSVLMNLGQFHENWIVNYPLR